jgi:hypothetical protein
MDEPQSLTELLAVDDMTRAFHPMGLSGALLPSEESLRYLRDAIERAQLVPTVPETVRNNFERVRKTFLYGLMEYDLFTVADDDARLVLEGALRVRFVTLYGGEITVIRDGQPKTIRGEWFDDFYKRLRRDDLLVTRDGRHHDLSLGTAGLFNWARKERLLVGQRSVGNDKTMGRLRHFVAHPDGVHRHGPPDAARTLDRVAEYINKLWGADTPGGRLFPAPIDRVPRVVALSADKVRCVTFPSVRSVREGAASVAGGTFAVYLAPPEEELCGISGGLHFKYRPGVQCTRLPCDLLWGPGPLEQLLPSLARYEDQALTDSVSHLDRLFVLRVDGEQIEDPRSPDDFRASSENDGAWHVVIADYPEDALWHVRRHGSRPPSEQNARCTECCVTELGRFQNRPDVEQCLAHYERC